MTGLFTVMPYPAGRPRGSLTRAVGLACAVLLLLITPLAGGQSLAIEQELRALTIEREMLTGELDQYKSTVALLQRDTATPPEQSSNPAVRKLALEMVRIKERLIGVTEREVTLLQEQISAARQLAEAAPRETAPASAIESKPLRMNTRDYSAASEAENVERLHSLLANYYAELQESARTLPSPEELAARAAAQLDAERLARIPFSADKVRLNGAEGSTALSQITRRLTDPNIPESRRDVAPIAGIRTQLFGSLIASERRGLKPVGKNNFVARVRLQPGETTIRILESSWQVHLPKNVNAGDFLITFYTPPGSPPELHLFAIDDLLAEEEPHIPAWLPEDVNLPPRPG